MITNEIINQKFIQSIVSRDSAIIYDTQAEVVSNYLNYRTGNLTHSISRREFQVDNTSFSFPILTYMRYLDIHYRKSMLAFRANLSIYNRVIWGVLYHETLPDLRFGLTQDIKNKIHAQLAERDSELTIQFPE